MTGLALTETLVHRCPRVSYKITVGDTACVHEWRILFTDEHLVHSCYSGIFAGYIGLNRKLRMIISAQVK